MHIAAVQKPATINSADTILNVSLLPGNLLSGFVRDVNGVGIPAIDLQVVDRDTGDPVLAPGDDTDATENEAFWSKVADGLAHQVRWKTEHSYLLKEKNQP